MPAGLQIFDAYGRLTVDLTTRLARIIGQTYLDGKQPSGVISNPLFAQGDIFLAFQQEGLWGFIDMNVSRPIFTIPARGGTWMETRLRVALAHGYRCVDCGRVWDAQRDQIDHVTPLEQGGSNDDANLAPRCDDCHAAKTAAEAAARAGRGTIESSRQ